LLTADLVKARRYKGELRLPKLKDRALLEETAAALVEAVRLAVGEPRADVESALTLDVPAKHQPLARGLKKLVLDRCQFEEPAGTPPPELRQALFRAASGSWRSSSEPPSRDAVIAAVADDLGLSADDLEEQLFADLREAQRLTAVDLTSPDELLEVYELARPQAVLLKARELRADVACEDAATLRAVFRSLKFHGLLFRAEPRGETTRLTLDGPFSLFKQSTKYGLRLAIALKALAACDVCRLEADVVWGKARQDALFKWDAAELSRRPPPPAAAPRDEVDRCLADLRALEGPWDAEAAATVLDVAGQEVCVPDVTLVHRETGQVVYLEVLGFWSRDAVWRRVEWVEAGLLPENVVFAYSSRLRVSERALEEDAPSCLLPFKGVLRAKKVIEAAEGLIA
jgi:predicted nuclease of restriction endonuclease-like RecB superfamily